MLINYLEERFERNKPILFEDIVYGDYSQVWLFKELNKLCSEGKLKKYSKGIYYLPVQSRLGGIKSLDPYDVIEIKYIRNKNEVYGFYSGWGLLNSIGISTQMPSVAAICSNNEASRKRTITLDNRKFVLRKPYLEITKDNIETVRFLDVITEMPEWFVFDKEKTTAILNYFNDKGISKKSVSECSKSFPEKTSKRLIESEMIYSVN
jgi:hypothetical protein